MADCSEDDSKPAASSRNKAATKRSKNTSKLGSGQSESGKSEPNKQIATSSSGELPPPAKRRKVDRFFDAPSPGIRTGLRSQTTKAEIVAGTSQSTGATGSQPSTSSGYNTTRPLTRPPTGSCAENTSAVTTESSSGAEGSSKASTEESSRQSTRFKSAKSAGPAAGPAAGPSASKLSSGDSEEISSRSQLTARRRRGVQAATIASEAKTRKVSRKGAATSSSSTATTLTQPKTTTSTRRGTKVATTGEASSRLKRSTASAGGGGSSSQSERTAANTTSSSSSARRRAARGAAASASNAASSSATSTASSLAASRAGIEAGLGPGLGEMSTPSNHGNPGPNPGSGSSGNNSEDIPPVLHHMAGGLLSEVLRGAATDVAGAAGGASGGAVSDMDMQRLQAMLEARGLPPHMFGTLESNMRNIIQRSMSSSAMTKVTSLIKGMQAKEDEGQQLTSVMEMCQILVMGNEENLAGFPTKQVVPELVALLHIEHNFDIMMYACRALYYMLEALPRSSLTVVEATPALLDKLKCIQCMDVAEQSLSALDRLSKRHSKNLLQSGAIAACLMYLDFFSIDAQRYALAVAANCCVNLSPEEFHYCRESLPLLSSKLLTADKRSVESVCTCFARLVDNLRFDEKLLKELAAHEMLANTLKLLEVAPPVVSSSIFTMVIRMFVVMCCSCPDLAVCLLRQSVSSTLVYLLCGDQGASNHVELVTRTPQELFEVVSLIGELMPALPTTGLFTVDALLRKHPSLALYEEEVTWQWKDDKGTWRAYTPIDSRIIEAAYEASEEEVTLSLSDMGRMYTIDFTMMQQINEETGTSRHVFRSTNSQSNKKVGSAAGSSGKPEKPDARAEVLAEQPDLATDFIKSLFGVLYEVYSSSAGPAVRHKCLQAILRQIYYASPELLRDVLVNQPVSSHIASMLASQDHKVVVGALQMADILMRKLPETFTQYFQRQGVTHQIKNLASSYTASTSTEVGAVPPSTSTATDKLKISSSSSAEQVSSSTDAQLEVKMSVSASTAAASAAAAAATSAPVGLSAAGPSKSEGAAAARSKKTSKRVATRLVKTRSCTIDSQFGDSSSSSAPSTRGKLSTKRAESSSALGSSAAAASGSGSAGAAGSSGKHSKASFLSSLHPSRWASRSSADKSVPPPVESRGMSTAALLQNYREKIKSWITTHANEFMNEHFSKLNVTAGKAEGVLLSLSKAAVMLSSHDKRGAAQKNREALEIIARTVAEDDVSPFEMIHSGVIEKLLLYLTTTHQVASTSTSISDSLIPLEKRLALFMNIFIGSPAKPSTRCQQSDIAEEGRLVHLVSKTMACLHQQEQFQVKVHDLGIGGGSANSNAMKFLSSHQLKCQLQRHPECKSFRQYEGGPVKVDPLAPVHAIENFLIRHGYCKPDGTADPSDIEAISDDDDGNSVDDLDDSMPGMLVEQRLGKHTIELMLGDRPLSYNQTVLQAIRNHAPIDDTDSDHALGGSSVWAHTHLIWYRQVSPEGSASTKHPAAVASKKTRADNSSKSRKSRKSHDFFNDGQISPVVSPLISSLSRNISDRISIQDSCVESVSLIRTLYYINRFWGSLYGMLSYGPVVPDSVFISTKLAAKANRQLQDPLVIMTGNIPLWLPQVAGSCPFLFPFETRQLLFYVNSFDRDRAMMRLQEANIDTMDMDTSTRVAPPRLEKKKKVISRDNLIKQAEHIFEDVGKTKSLLEIQYENEVGTGLGPTLEFYSLVSKELQAADLDIWYSQSEGIPEQDAETKVYVDSKHGLYPKPLARNAKPAAVSKLKAKFRFIGKLLAKALMDSRILDLPLNPIVYCWLMGQQKILTPSDLSTFDPAIATSYSQLKSLSDKVSDIRADTTLSVEEQDKLMSEVGIEHLCLDFTLPGYSSIALKKGGSSEAVTADNIGEYLQLLCHWIFSEGIHRQMEAMKEGFDVVFASTHLSDLFTAEELEQLFCGNKSTKWDTKELFDCCRADHGYTMDSKTVQNLFEVLSSYDSEQQRKFLSFVTGSPRLPVGGFRSLNPQLTIVRKTFDTSENPDDFLPSVMTCVNYLKLPDYSSIDIMRLKFETAATIGQLSFHLS